MSTEKMTKQKHGQRVEVNNNDPLLTSAEVARLFTVSQSTVWRWVAEGKIESVRFPSGLRRVKLSDVQKILGAVAAERFG